MQNLIDILTLKSVPVTEFSETENFIKIKLPPDSAVAWGKLFTMLNLLYNNIFKFEPESDNIYKIVSEKEGCPVLFNAILNDEYKIYSSNFIRVYDVKLGISCNNNCIHCVIKPNVNDIKEKCPESVILDSGTGMQCLKDPTYEEVINKLSHNSKNVRTFVLTGGEPTIRKDFIPILKWLYYNRPHSSVSLQTNGRNLSDENMVRAICRYSRKPSFVVALHGTEETHNFIVNNRKEKGNPYKETIAGIHNLIKYFDIGSIRTEMVVSKHNLNNLIPSIHYQYKELGVRQIGLSYPHLEGFSDKDISLIAPNMLDLLPVLVKLNNFAIENTDLSLIFEEVPFCILARIEGPIRLNLFDTDKTEVSVCDFHDRKIANFRPVWLDSHFKPKTCGKCVATKSCPGIWKENKKLNQKNLIPMETIPVNIEKFFTGGCQ